MSKSSTSSAAARAKTSDAAQSQDQPTPEASRRAAAILEVLAGQRTATEAADALQISVNHYYLLERKALRGLTSACEVQPKGPRGPGPEAQLQTLQRELDQCRRECLRQTALVRATQRAVGLASLPESNAKGRRKASGKRTRPAKKRKPAVRALRAAREARKNSSGPETPPAVEKELSRGGNTESGTASPDLPLVKEHNDGTSG